MPLYLDQSHSEADSQDEPDVCEEPALHVGSTTLITNTGRLIWQTTARWQQTGDGMTEKSVYHIVYGPVRRLSLTESAVGEVSGSQWDVLAGAGKQQLGAVDDDHVPVPVETTGPATALHLQVDKQPAVQSTNRQQARMETQRPTERSKQIFRQEWTHLIWYYWSVRLLFLCVCAGDSRAGGIMSPGCLSVCTYIRTYVRTYVNPDFLWTRYLKNAVRDFLQIWYKGPLGLKDDLIRFWKS